MIQGIAATYGYGSFCYIEDGTAEIERRAGSTQAERMMYDYDV